MARTPHDREARPPASDEAGITLIEIAVSIVILGVVLTAFFSVMSGNLQSLSDSRARQEASFQSAEIIEQLRELPIESAAMASTYDPTLVSCGGTDGEVDVQGDGSLCEPLFIDPLVAAQRVDAGAPWADAAPPMTWATYVTSVTGSDLLRVTVVVDYEIAAGAQTVRRSTLISEVNRG